jgi:enamine deaminase RidA (YjgF/YER057c/UK114 family)
MREIERFGSGGRYEETIGYSRVVRAGDWVLTAGCTSVVDGELTHPSDAYGQAVTALRTALAALQRAGCPPERVVQCRMYVTAREHAEPVGRAHAAVLGEIRPAAIMVVVSGLIDERMLVEVELAGWTGD